MKDHLTQNSVSPPPPLRGVFLSVVIISIRSLYSQRCERGESVEE